MNIADTPKPPYYAVIFTSIRTEGDNEYAENADKILELARQQPGFLGFESARSEIGISVSYWKDEKSIAAWKKHVDHIQVQKKASVWYKNFHVRVCRVERDYGI